MTPDKLFEFISFGKNKSNYLMFRPDMRKMMKADTICQENEVSINVLSNMILNKDKSCP